MDNHIKVIQTLAKGVDPTTGEVFPQDSPYNNPNVIRALFYASQQLVQPRNSKQTVEQKQQQNAAKGLPKNAGVRWTDSDRQHVADGFRAGQDVDQLAHSFQRTPNGIKAELIRQKLMV
ncbi:hypothetical protein [Thalassotalea agarivorans]|uniref:Uncharacterized protein n=1 Tax=Thalassotalea agarivorans TaxID=349064 RepID=A0A1I0AJL9_THASX|nr:hypothetical protein [Thalassotalea agarivorans]SES94549.1 hypothetical protein SAMN05660429_00731 [Thalassotalea agarivorans]